MNNTIKQHYVPRFYLKNFSNKKKKEYCIWCYDIKQNRPYPANIKNIAESKNFYKIENQDFEEDFQINEKECAPIINNLSSNGKTKPLDNINTRGQLSIFMSIQFLRTNEMRKTILEHGHKFSSYLENLELTEDMEKTKEILGEKYIKHHQIEMIHDFTPDLTFELFYKKWILLKNKTETLFWTSDNPIVRYNPHGNIGFGCDYIHIFYPINPKLCLCLVDPTKYSNFEKEKEFSQEDVMSNIRRTSSFKLEENEKINFINGLQVKFATQHLFSKNGDYDKIPDLIKNNMIKPGEEKERVNFGVFKNPENGNDILHFSHPK